jgi:hypothetical protein
MARSSHGVSGHHGDLCVLRGKNNRVAGGIKLGIMDPFADESFTKFSKLNLYRVAHEVIFGPHFPREVFSEKGTAFSRSGRPRAAYEARRGRYA